MKKGFLEILDMTRNRVKEIMYMIKHRTKQTYFTRNTGKLEFSEAVFLLITGFRKTLQIEVDNWFENQGKEQKMTKQSFSELRQKISPTALIELNDLFVEWYYQDGDFKKYREYRLLGIDGSITEIPNTECNREYFGYYHNQSEWKQSRAMMSTVYDIENDIIIESNICSWKSGEREVAKELIDKVCSKGKQNDLYLFDRGYPSKDMYYYLMKEQKVKFLMRVKNKGFQKQTDNANLPDQLVEIPYKGEPLKLRVINVELETGETEKLVTNLYEEDIDFKELYFRRWGIEVKYCQLKSRYELENFSGNSQIAIEQDFYANIYLSNMLTIAKEEANNDIAKKEGLKYEYKVNMNILIGKMIPMLVKSLCVENHEQRGELYNKTMLEITRNLVPIRHGRQFNRREPSRKNKYPYTRKRSL